MTMDKHYSDQNSSAAKKHRSIRIPIRVLSKFDQPVLLTFLRALWKYTRIIIGSLIAAGGFSVFQVPFNLAAGGVTGLGIIITHFNNLPMGMTVLVLNIPLILLGFYQLGRWHFLFSCLVGVLSLSLAIDFLNIYLPVISSEWPITEDRLLASIYAGVLFGVGLGIVYRAGGTLGGTSIPARIIYERMGFPMSQSYLFTDGAIILLAGVVFEWEVALLAALALVLSGIFTDFITEGVSQVRTATIVTKKPEDVRYAIIYKLRRGVSLWDIQGGYSKAPHTMIFCTILRSRLNELKFAISTVDPDAFVVIGVAQQVVGGYNQRMPARMIKEEQCSDSGN